MNPIDRTLELAGTIHEVHVAPAGEPDDRRVRVTLDDDDPIEAELPASMDGAFTLRMGGRRFTVAVARDGNAVEVAVNGERFQLRPAASAASGGAAADVGGPVRAPMPGKVVDIPVAVGDAVVAGDPVIVVEAMKLRNSLAATTTGTIAAIHCQLDEQVNAGQVLVEIEEGGEEE